MCKAILDTNFIKELIYTKEIDEIKDILKELCDLVHPTYGILTTIGTAHLESFGSEENIIKGNFF